MRAAVLELDNSRALNAMRRRPVDPTEAHLRSEVERRRANLLARAEAWRSSVAETFAPQAALLRSPLGSILTLVGAGILLALGSRRRAKASSDPKPRPRNPALVVAEDLLKDTLPALVARLVALAVTRPRSRESSSEKQSPEPGRAAES